MYLLIGSGRVARHLSYYMKTLGLPFEQWSRQSKFQSELTAFSASELQNKLKKSSHLLLAISDSALKDFYQEHLKYYSGKVIHFSGALEIPGIHGAHPLMSFGPELFDLETYKKIPFVLTEGSISDFLPGFPNPAYFIKLEQKPYYHALCVLGGNLPTILWGKLLTGLTELGLPQSIGKQYIQQCVENFVTNSSQALTGPLARKDELTIQKNLESLQGDLFQAVYRSFIPVAMNNKERTNNENSRLQSL
jgi:2-dehydropantoate 2-reductase